MHFIHSNGRKNTFVWLKVVSEVSFPRFLGVLCFEMCVRNSISVIGSAISKISRFARFQNDEMVDVNASCAIVIE